MATTTAGSGVTGGDQYNRFKEFLVLSWVFFHNKTFVSEGILFPISAKLKPPSGLCEVV